MTTQQQVFTFRVIAQIVLFVVLIPLLPLIISWQWDWWEAWIFALLCILNFVISRVMVARRNPDLLAERARMLRHDDAKSWDKILAPVVALGGGLVPLVAGFDARFGWSTGFSTPVKLAALVIIVAGLALGSYALLENSYFSGMVRIQKDRKQHVISSGPYRWMRHPGYTGALLTFLATPIFLDSAWAFVPALLLTVALVLRTALEDQTLIAELTGYRDYTERVHYRLVPGLW